MDRGTEGLVESRNKAREPTYQQVWLQGQMASNLQTGFSRVVRAGRGAEHLHGLPKYNEEKQTLGLLAPGPAAGLQIGCQGSPDRK